MTSLLDRFNTGLAEIRELFHKSGRLDDSNAKLDEITKLLCLEIAAVHSRNSSLKDILNARNKDSLVQRLNDALSVAATTPLFLNDDGASLLGVNPTLAIGDTVSDNLLAEKLVRLVIETFNGHLRNPEDSHTFEALNEAFGHFVRDNFRNNIEDAQYMTPQEVVDFMCQLSLGISARLNLIKNGRPITVCDPSCGVGSFLAQFYRIFSTKYPKHTRPKLVGQDKVDRMARLARLNMLLYGFSKPSISRGNSLLSPSSLDSVIGKCDVILTNPPFGARFQTSELAFDAFKYYPLLSSVITTTETQLPSELLFVDRYLNLLTDNGIALAVLPDAVISASGIFENFRAQLADKYQVLCIIELPAVTFAQAGTRTKTCVLVIRKCPAKEYDRVIFGQSQSLGFEVSSRKGVPYKRIEGKNELPELLDSIMAALRSDARLGIHSENPSCVSDERAILTKEEWTPNHHSASRYRVLQNLKHGARKGQRRSLRLSEMVLLPNTSRKNMRKDRPAKCISVLHIGDFGSFNIREFMEYVPKYPGQLCRPGDILLSKINPRIPRAFVVPDLGVQLTCSNEFEVMQSRESFSAHEIMLHLLSPNTQAQIQALTSGTSSSHNRIKTAQLMEIVITLPNENSPEWTKYNENVKIFAKSHSQLISAQKEMFQAWSDI